MSLSVIRPTFLTRVIRAIPRNLMIIVAFAVITACSTTQVAYNNADWFITRVANNHLDLSDDQENAWSPTLQRVLQRHRDEELSHIVAFLTNLEELVEAGLTESNLVCVQDHLDDLYRRTAGLVVAIASPLLVGLSDAQIRHLEDRMQERQEDYRHEYFEGTSSQRLDRRVERVHQRIVRWTGELRSEQKIHIRRAVMTWPDVSRDWSDYRAHKQRQLLAVVTEIPPRAEMDQFLTRWWLEFADRPPALRQKHELLRKGIIELLASLDETFSDAQRTRLIENIQDVRSDLQGLLPDPIGASLIASWGCPPLTRTSRQGSEFRVHVAENDIH